MAETTSKRKKNKEEYFFTGPPGVSYDVNSYKDKDHSDN
jgi:hypothetical protein